MTPIWSSLRDLAGQHTRTTAALGVAILAVASGGIAYAATAGRTTSTAVSAAPTTTPVPSTTVPSNTVPSNTVPSNTVPSTAAPSTAPPPTSAAASPSTSMTLPTTTRPVVRSRTRVVGAVLRGTVTVVHGDDWTVTSLRGVAFTVVVTAGTAFGPRSSPTTGAAFPPGAQVLVVGDREGRVVTAWRIRPPTPPRPAPMTTTIVPSPTTPPTAGP